MVEEYTRWRQQGEELLAKLESDWDTRVAELVELKSAIIQLRASLSLKETKGDEDPKEEGEEIILPNEPATSLRQLNVVSAQSVVDVVRKALRHLRKPSPARSVYELVQTVRPTLEPVDIHRALYRLKEMGEVEVTGERPNSFYALKEDAQAAIPLAK